jgi:hypothetical protein
MEEEKTATPSQDTSRTANTVVLTILGVIFLSLLLFFLLKMPKIIKSSFGKRLKTILIFLFFSIGILFRIIFSFNYFVHFPDNILAILRPLPIIFYTLSTSILSYYLLKSLLIMVFQHKTSQPSLETITSINSNNSINSQLLQKEDQNLPSKSKSKSTSNSSSNSSSKSFNCILKSPGLRLTKSKLIYILYFLTLGLQMVFNGMVCLPIGLKQHISEFAILLLFTIFSFLLSLWFYAILIMLYYVTKKYYPFTFKEFQIMRIVFFCAMIDFAVLFNFLAYLLIIVDFNAFHSCLHSHAFSSSVSSSVIMLMLGVFFFICRELIPMVFLMKYFLKQSELYGSMKNSKNPNCEIVLKRRTSSGIIESVVKCSDYEGFNQSECGCIINQSDTNFREKSTEYSEQRNHNSKDWEEEKQIINEIDSEEDDESQFSFVSLVADSYTQQLIENDSYLQHKFVITYM